VTMKWWVNMDWAGAHRVQLTDRVLYEEWDGPFNSFSQMQRYIIKAGVYEASQIVDQTRDWRSMRRGDVELVDR